MDVTLSERQRPCLSSYKNFEDDTKILGHESVLFLLIDYYKALRAKHSRVWDG